MAYTTINKSGDYFNTKLYSGTGSTNAITGVGFEPSLTWIKARDHAYSHHLQDAVRGTGKDLYSNSTDAEYSNANSLTTFGSDGFTVGSDNGVNNGSKTYASWNWKANGAGSANTDGSINSTVSANTTSGFSIVSWQGSGSNATIGHGLGVAPSMIIFFNRDYAINHAVYHKSIGATKTLYLSLTDASATVNYYQDTAPTSSVFSVVNDGAVSGSGHNMIAYCFAEKTGYSKFGSYTGNGSTDGTFIYTGFKPAFFLIKNTDDGTDDWQIMDNKRNGYNPQNNILQPNLSDAEGSSTRVDFLSNGVKINSSSAFINGSGEKIIYMAFAEAPLVGTNNVPCTAR
jgi:hypothetical protein